MLKDTQRLRLRAATLLLTACAATATADKLPPRPQLVVGIVVDGLSMDHIELMREHFGEGGFNSLMREGVTIHDVDYGTNLDASAATAVLFTGAAPAVNGVAASTVFDRASRRPRPVLYDAGAMGNFTDETLSPAALLVSTIADENKIDTGGLGYVHSIAADPTQAIVMSGHAGNSAFWINDTNGKWATTTYYKDFVPTPIQSTNFSAPLDMRLDTLRWQPSMAVERYPDLPAHKKLYPFRVMFLRSNPLRIPAYKNSPAYNTDVTTLACQYLQQVGLGKREATDMLNLSYTLQPFIYGRDADTRLELMDSYLKLDHDLTRLFDAIDSAGPGLDHTLVFVAGTPLTSRSRRDDEKWVIPTGEFSSRKAVSLLNMFLMAIYGNGDWVSGYHDGQIFLNHQLVKDRNLDLKAMRTEAAGFLTQMSGVSATYTIDDIISRRAGDNPEALRRNVNLATAGDVYLTIAPGWQEIDDDGDTERPSTVSRSVSPTAPAFFLAPGLIPHRTIDTPVDARVIAPTVTGLLRIRSPNGASQPRLRLEK